MSKSESTAKPLICGECGKEIEGLWVLRETEKDVKLLCYDCYVKGYGGRVGG